MKRVRLIKASDVKVGDVVVLNLNKSLPSNGELVLEVKIKALLTDTVYIETLESGKTRLYERDIDSDVLLLGRRKVRGQPRKSHSQRGGLPPSLL